MRRSAQVVRRRIDGGRTRLMSAALVAAIVCLGAVPSAQAAPGDLDPSFGTGGRVTTDFAGFHDEARAVVIQPDGKIIAGGFTDGPILDFALVRYNTDGSLDSSFGTGGRVSTPFPGEFSFVNALALRPDGKIVAVGTTFSEKFALARYNADGTLDSSFGTGGLVVTTVGLLGHATSAVLQSDGRIVVVGQVVTGVTPSGYNLDFIVVRYQADGALDTGFGVNGVVLTDFTLIDAARAVAVQGDGKIIVAGFTNGASSIAADYALARYNSDGTPDSGFGSGGVVTTDFPVDSPASDVANALVLQLDGKILVGGVHFPQGGSAKGAAFALARYTQSGTLDSSFGGGGQVITDFSSGFTDDEATSAVLQPDGKIVLGGYSGITGFPTTVQDFALARYNANGTIDATFGTGGTVVTDFGAVDTVRGLVLQMDGKIVAAGITSLSSTGGDTNFAVARYLGDPTVPTCNGKPATIVGAAGDSAVTGTSGADVIVDLTGNNKIRAMGGNDTICTGPGNDGINGGGGNDWIDAGYGTNSAEGNAGQDTIITGSGNDELEGNGGNDTLTGGAGADRFRGGDGTDTATDFRPAEGDTKVSVEVVL